MKTFIFADRDDAGLAPLTRHTCPALLPVAGKTVIEYTIDDLARAGIREAVIVASAHADRAQAYLGGGERWGMSFDYFPSRGGEHPAALLSRYGSDLREPLLLVRGDIMRSSVTGFIDTAASDGGAITEARVGGSPVGLCLCPAGMATKLATLEWPFAAAPDETLPASSLELQHDTWSALDSLAAYHRANLDVAAGRYPGVKPAGWARQDGLTVGRGSHVAAQSLSGEHAFVGRGSRVHPGAQLAGTSVISDGCLIDNGASITDSVILPGTYIGENIEVRNAIVNGNQVIRVDSGASYRVPDSFLLTQMQPVGESLPARLTNRLAGLILLPLSLPLWPVAAVGSLLRSPSAPLRPVRLRSNRYRHDERHEPVPDTFTGYQWAVNAPVLRHLPLLLAVISGHINLVGTRPRPVATDSGDGTPWERAAGETPAGLLGPVQLDLPADAPAEEGLLNEIYYAQCRSLKSDIGYLLKGIRRMFSGRAWSAPRAAGNH